MIDHVTQWRRRGWLTCKAWLKAMLPYRLLNMFEAYGDDDREKARQALRNARACVLQVMKRYGYSVHSARGFPTRRAFQRTAAADVRLPTNAEYQAYVTVHMAFVETVLSLTLASPWSQVLVRDAVHAERIAGVCQVVSKWRCERRFEHINTATQQIILLLRMAARRLHGAPTGSSLVV